MKCQDFRELIDSYLSDELLTETNHDVLRHLEQCADCRKTIESRRMFRTRLRAAVINVPDFQMREDFYNDLRNDLRENFLPKKQETASIWANYKFQFAVAACLLIAVTFGFLIVRNLNNNKSQTELAAARNTKQSTYFEKIAFGDHQNCAVDFNLSEPPIEIDLASPEYANLRQGILTPLENAAAEYKLHDSHICKYKGQTFTHLVFQRGDKLVSFLMMNLQDYKSLENKNIVKSAANGYQMAHFDEADKAFFVVSNLSEKENSAMAEIVKNPLHTQFSNPQYTSLISLTNFKR